MEFGFDHVCVATGSSWRRDGTGRSSATGFDGHPHENVTTPDEVMTGAKISGPVVVYDDDNFYLGGLIAERVREQGHEVILVTSDGLVSPATNVTLEQHRIQSRILDKGIKVIVSHHVSGFDGATAHLICAFSGREQAQPAATLIPVTSREPNEDLYLELRDAISTGQSNIKSVTRIGDCVRPAQSRLRCLPVIGMRESWGPIGLTYCGMGSPTFLL